MARKINLKGLFDTGLLSSSLEAGAVNALSNGIGAMFDNDPNLTTKFETDPLHFLGSGVSAVKLTFIPPIQGKNFRLKTNIKGINSGSNKAFISVNGGPNITRNGPSSISTIIQHNYDFNISGLSSIKLNQSAATTNTSFDIEIFNIELFVIDEADPYEFNDSVLTTQAWNSSRYTGKQLIGSKINSARRDDVGNNDRIPIIQNYSRNIYIGSRVIGMTEPGVTGSFDDPTLTPFPGFSYVTVDEYITVNSDDSITRRSVRGGRGEGDDLNARKGFYQAWYQDFPIGKQVQVKPLDKKLAQSLSPRYNVFNNSGQLQKMLLVNQHPAGDTVDSGSYYAASYETSSFIFDYCSGSGNPDGSNDIGADFNIFNYLLLSQKFFTGSLIANPTPDGLGSILTSLG